MNRFRYLLLIGGVVFSAAAVPLASAAPVCSDVPEIVCGNRIFAEPARSATFVQLENGEYEGGIKALATRFPRYVRVSTLSDLMGDPTAVSYDGREIWVIEVTDFNAPEEGKVPVVVSLSVHGIERAGLEGGVRYAEDLARWATAEPNRLLRNGTDPDSTSFTVRDVLSRTHLYLANANPDGWAAGDLASGGQYTRGNGSGEDLNREFPTLGWVRRAHSPMSEPEAIAWSRFVESIDPVMTADLHGELTSVNNAFADMMLPAGQWDPLMQAREESLARHMKSNVYRYFDEHNVVLGDIAAALAGMRPADYATGYDVVGYDDSGFMGDYFTQIGAVDMDVEHFLSHMAPGSMWLVPLEEAHVAAVRAEIETLLVEGLVTDDIRVSLDLGNTGYLFDPRVVTSEDGYGGPAPPNGITPEPYSATPMAYFEDLGRFAGTPLRAIPSAEVVPSDELADRGLGDLDSFVITTWPLPPDSQDRPVDQAAAVDAIRSFVQSGGNLILTDEALKLAEELGVVPSGSVSRSNLGAGHIDIQNFNDAYTKGLHTTASQTYYEVPLGYSLSSPGNTSPHWTVSDAAWKAAGGTTVGTIGSGRVGLGRIPSGQGTIGIVGALLPPPVEKWDHYFGLADYAVTVAGGQILNNMLSAA